MQYAGRYDWVAVIWLAAAWLTGCGGNGNTISPQQPSAFFTISPEAGTTRTIYTVDASMCGDDTDGLTALQVRWDWENDGAFDTSFTTQKIAKHQYLTPGTYTVCMEVRDSHGLTTVDRRTVRVEPESMVIIDPAGARVNVGESCQFTATVTGVDDSSVIWSATGGAIEDGRYMAPLVPGIYSVTATSIADPTATAAATVEVVAISTTTRTN